MYDRVLIIVFGCVVISTKGATLDGYYYPQPPLQFDEVPSPIYLPPPPAAYPPIATPPPLDDTVIVGAPPLNQYLPGRTAQSNPIQVINMSCVNSQNGYFRATFRAGRIFPVIEQTVEGCTVSSPTSETFAVDFEGQKLLECGVKGCGTNMCLVLRMAKVEGLKLFDDTLITLQCVPQESVVSHTKHFRLNALSENPSSLSRSTANSIPVATGGHQQKFDSQISILRKSASGMFDQMIQPGSSVRLGDDLLLRTSVRSGDGWYYARMSSVIIRSTSTQRSITLLDENGCRSPNIYWVCPQSPQQVTSLTTELPFRTFLFQGAPPADELLLSVKMLACLNLNDCQKNCGSNNHNRIIRSLNTSKTLKESEFMFRVLPERFEDFEKINVKMLVIMGVVGVLFGCLLVLIGKPICAKAG